MTLGQALEVAERFCTYAAKTADPADGAIGDRLVGVALGALGDQEGARRRQKSYRASCINR